MTKYEYPCCNNFFFSHPFSRRYQSLQNSSIVKCRFFYMYLSSVRSLFRPVRIYLNLFTISSQKMLTSKSHLGIPGFVSSPRQSLNKSESSNYTANGDLAIKSMFVNIVSSAILNSQAGYRCTLVPSLPFPVPR